MKGLFVPNQLNRGTQSSWVTTFCILSISLFSVFEIRGCPGLFSSVGENAANIIATDVIPKLTRESQQWRELAAQTSEKLPAEFRDQFNRVIDHAAIAAESNVQCIADFAFKRLGEDLLALGDKWRGKGSGPTPVPHVCNTAPLVIQLNKYGQPEEDQDWVVKFEGYDMLDYDNQFLVRVELEYKDNRPRLDITKCCLDKPTHYILTVKLSDIPDNDFSIINRIVLVKNGQVLYSVTFNPFHQPPPQCPEDLDTASYRKSNKFLFNLLISRSSAAEVEQVIRTRLEQGIGTVLFFKHVGYQGEWIESPSKDQSGLVGQGRIKGSLHDEISSFLFFAPENQALVLHIFQNVNFSGSNIRFCDPTAVPSMGELNKVRDDNMDSFQFEQ